MTRFVALVVGRWWWWWGMTQQWMATDFDDERKRKSRSRRKVGRAIEQYHKNRHLRAVRKARVGVFVVSCLCVLHVQLCACEGYPCPTGL